MESLSARSLGSGGYLADRVAAHLRGLIHRGEVGPGDRLPSERELAAQLGVARLSLREALKVLQEAGYVEARRGAHGGTFVTQLERPLANWRARMLEKSGEFDDLMDFRVGLESQAARLAAARRSDADLEILAKSIDDLAHVRSRDDSRQVDARFHEGLAQAADSPRLAQGIRTARGELFTPYDLLDFIDPVGETRRDHQAVFVAVRDQDEDAAATAIRIHIEHTRRQLRAIVFGVAEPRR